MNEPDNGGGMEIMDTIDYASLRKTARIAGILYLIIIVSGIFSEMLVRSSIVVPGDAAATAGNIMASAPLFRIGFASDLIMVICDIGIALAFYVLLRPINRALALLAAFFRMAQAAILGINLLNHFTALLLLNGAGYLKAFETDQLQALVLLFLNMHAHGYLISGVFFACSLLVLGYLFFKAEYFPRVFGYLLLFATFGYLVDSFTNFLAPNYAAVTEWLVVASAVIAELSLCVWLLVKGIKNPE
jgi:hypothetical protein